MHTITDKKLLMLRPDEIVPAEHQPRKNFDEYELQALADSISANGIIQPLTVRKNQNGSYELIAGERRLRAARIAGVRRVPCVLHRTDDRSAAVYALVENLQRCDLDFFEEATAIQRLISTCGISRTEAAARLGIAQSTLSNKLRLLQLEASLRSRIISARLTERHARALLRLEAKMRNDTLDRIIASELDVKQSEELIEQIVNPKEEPQKPEPIQPIRKSAIGDIRLFANSLSKLLCTMQNAGIEAHSRRHETEKYIEYKVRISKTSPERYTQLCMVGLDSPQNKTG